MPDFVYDHKIYYNPVEFAFAFIGGTWKMPILYRLNKATMRYSELKRSLPHISPKMLSVVLKELEADGYITRQMYAQVPPKVEYTITEEGRKVIPVIEAVRNYGLYLMEQKGVSEGKGPHPVAE